MQTHLRQIRLLMNDLDLTSLRIFVTACDAENIACIAVEDVQARGRADRRRSDLG